MIELFLTTKVNVYNYSVTSSGATNIGGLIRTDNNKGYRLDLFEGEKIPITYQIQDAIDPSKKKAPYSKMFLIPGTKRNSIALEFPYMISSNVQYSLYNGSVVETGVTGIYEWHLPVQEAQLYVDSILAFTGQLELSRAIINNGEVNSFEVNFMATQINIFDELQNKNMRDLDLPTPQIASVSDVNKIFGVTKAGPSGESFTLAGQTYSGWTLAYPDWGFPAMGPTGYANDGVPVYATTGNSKVLGVSVTPPTDTNNVGLEVGYNFTFYAFVRYLVDKIFEGIDFSYESTFFDSDEFVKLLLLCYDYSQPPSNTGFKIFGSNPSATTYYKDQFFPFPVDTCPLAQTYSVVNFNKSGKVPSTSPFNPNQNLQDEFEIFVGGGFEFKSAGVYNVRLRAVVDIRFGWDMLYNTQGALCPGGTPNANVYPWATASLLGPNSEIYFYNERTGVKITQNIAGLAVDNTALATPSTYVKGGVTHYQWETSHDAYSTFLNYTLLVQPGDIWKLYFVADSSNYCNQAVAVGCTNFPIRRRKYEAALDVLAMDVSPLYPNWNQTLPDISQKDFLVALIKHFNLYSEISPNSRVLTIEPRDTFFNFGNVQDWTNKMDLASVREIQKSDYPEYVIARMFKTSNVLDKQRQDSTEDELEYGSYKEFLTDGKGQPQEIKSDFGSLSPDNIKYIGTQGGTADFVQTPLIVSLPETLEILYNIPNPSLFSVDSNGDRKLTEKSAMYLAYRPDKVVPRSTGGKPMWVNFYLPGATGYIGNTEIDWANYTGGFSLNLIEVDDLVVTTKANFTQVPILGKTYRFASATDNTQYFAIRITSITSTLVRGICVFKLGSGTHSAWKVYLQNTADHLWSLSEIGQTGNDINFNPTQTTWLTGGDTPPVFSNLITNYDAYFKDYYLNLTDQKILKAQVRLEPADIARFSFRNPIWITFPNGDGDYFIVDSIQYDPTSYGNATVQLLTFNKEYFNFTYESVSPFAPGPDYPAPAPPGPAPALPPDQSGGGEYPIKGEA